MIYFEFQLCLFHKPSDIPDRVFAVVCVWKARMMLRSHGIICILVLAFVSFLSVANQSGPAAADALVSPTIHSNRHFKKLTTQSRQHLSGQSFSKISRKGSLTITFSSPINEPTLGNLDRPDQTLRNSFETNTTLEYQISDSCNTTLHRQSNVTEEIERKEYETKTFHSEKELYGASSRIVQLLSKWTKFSPQELQKVSSLSALMFFVVYIFVLSRDTKDTLIVTNCGAEAIAFLKVYGVVPAATLFMVVYSMLSQVFDNRQLFRIILTPFVAFFTVFGLFLYPLRQFLHGNSFLLSWIAQSGIFTGPLASVGKIFQYWTFSLYFIVSELWGSAAVSLLFWTLANDTVKFQEAKRMYPLITLIGNLAPLLSGITLANLATVTHTLQRSGPSILRSSTTSLLLSEEQSFEMSLKILSLLTAVSGFIILTLHRYITRSFPSTSVDASVQPSASATQQQKPKRKMSLKDSIAFLSNHTHLRQIAVMVLSYGLSIECTEILWKSVVHKAIPVRTDYLAFMGRYSFLIGVASAILMPIGAWLLQRFGWANAALLTPQTMVLFSLPFYGSILWAQWLAQTPLQRQKAWLIAVYVGLLLHVFTKAAKYAVFDPVKEMAYIPLEKNAKTTGKAAIDVLGARVGKSAGALMQQVVVLLFGGLVSGVPVMSVVFYAMLGAWTRAVKKLAPVLAEAETQRDTAEQQQQQQKETLKQQ